MDSLFGYSIQPRDRAFRVAHALSALVPIVATLCTRHHASQATRLTVRDESALSRGRINSVGRAPDHVSLAGRRSDYSGLYRVCGGTMGPGENLRGLPRSPRSRSGPHSRGYSVVSDGDDLGLTIRRAS